MAAHQGRGVRALPTTSAPAPLRAAEQRKRLRAPRAVCASLRGICALRPRSHGATPCPCRAECPPRPRPCPPERVVGAGSAAGSGPAPPRGRPGTPGGRRETIAGYRASTPAGAREGEGWARIRCPVRPWVGVSEGLRSGAGAGGPAGDGAGGTRSAPAERDPPAEGDISPWPKTPSTNTAAT